MEHERLEEEQRRLQEENQQASARLHQYTNAPQREASRAHLRRDEDLSEETLRNELEQAREDLRRANAESEQRYQAWAQRARREERNVNNLAGAISEVGRENYATTGGGPSRERLYDWAAASHAARQYSQHEETEENTASGDVDAEPRRELDRALRNYRSARNAIRSRATATGQDVGQVPTASALRAYWNEEPSEQDTNAVPATASPAPFTLSNFVEQHRLERQRRHQESVRRHNEQRARIEGQYEHHRYSRDLARCGPPLGSEAFTRVRNTMRYLAELRGRDVQGGLELAKELGLDSLYEESEPDHSIPSDLPMTINSLPKPQQSSWLQAGTTWHGLQSTDREPRRPELLSNTLRRIRHRDFVNRAMGRRGYTNDPYGEQGYRNMRSIPPEDADRYLTNLTQDPTGRWGFADEPSHPELPGSASGMGGLDASPLLAQDREDRGDADHWPVTVSLHEVDWEEMTVSGTMRASQIPDRSSEGEGKSMESYFQGEIVDFRNHTLLSDGRQFAYKVGGVDVDARYWARLGPFKDEIERASRSAGPIKKWDGKTKYVNWGAKPEGERRSSEERHRRELDSEDIMARCLRSTKWLREVGDQWVLMRWKGMLRSLTTTSALLTMPQRNVSLTQ